MNPGITTPVQHDNNYNQDVRRAQLQIALNSQEMLEAALEQFIEDEQLILNRLTPPRTTSLYLENALRHLNRLKSPRFFPPGEHIANQNIPSVSPSASQ